MGFVRELQATIETGALVSLCYQLVEDVGCFTNELGFVF